MHAETRSTNDQTVLDGVATTLTRQFRPSSVFVMLGVILALTLILLSRNGIFGISETFSDEHDHFKRTMMFAAILRGNMTLEAIGTFYAGGIWPPLYPMLMGSIQAATNAGVGFLRVVNVLLAYGGLALLIAAVSSRSARYAALVIVCLFSVGTHYYYQIRPENLVLLLLGAATYVIGRHALFSLQERPGQGGHYALCGTLCALACLSHAFLAVFAIYLLLLAFLSIKRRFWFAVAFSLVAGPYLMAQALIHNGVVLFATTAEENLARNNNEFLHDHPRPQADDLLFEEMERRYKAGDKVAYPRPLVLPQARYEQWLHDENKRRIFKEIALTEVRANPSATGYRAFGRLTTLVGGEGCVPGQRYDCNVGPRIDILAFYLLEVLAVIGLIFAVRSELSHARSFSYAIACAAMLAPMIATQAVERQFVIVLVLASLGGLARLKPRQI